MNKEYQNYIKLMNLKAQLQEKFGTTIWVSRECEEYDDRLYIWKCTVDGNEYCAAGLTEVECYNTLHLHLHLDV